MNPPLTVYMVGGITVVNADGSQETVHGALLKGDIDNPTAIQRAGAMLYRQVELVAARSEKTATGSGAIDSDPVFTYCPECTRPVRESERGLPACPGCGVA